MGYNSNVDGQIDVTPPLTWKELQEKGYSEDGRYTPDWTCVRLEVSSETVSTDEGVLTRFTADAIVPSTDDSFKAYGLMKDVQKIVSDFPDHTFSGYLYVEGEENNDMWRLYVKDGKAIQVKPEIVWPEV
jgi:hypothetical protein